MNKTGQNIRRRSDGRWEARIPLGKGEDGRYRSKSIYATTYEEVLQKKEAWQRGQAPPAGAAAPLFSAVAEQWLQQKRLTVRESTLACYTTLVKTYLEPQMGGTPIAELEGEALAAFFRTIKTQGRRHPLSEKTVADLCVLTRQIFVYAQAQNIIPAVPDFPVTAVRQRPIRVLSRQEQALLEAAARKEGTPVALGILLSLYGGLRIGEVCALKWNAFDAARGTVSVEHTLSRIRDGDAMPKTKIIIGPPKTASAVRMIPLPDPVFHFFMLHRGEDPSYLLTGRNQYMEPRVCLLQYKRFLRRVGLPDYTYHALRHTFATRCVESGVDVKALSELMGHSDIKITLRRYVHPSLDTKREQLNKLLKDAQAWEGTDRRRSTPMALEIPPS